MDDLDWTGVPPTRRPEIRRRIEIIERFLAIEHPTEDDRQDAGKELGLQRASFYRLVQAWKATRSPADLPGSSSTTKRHRTVSPEIEAIIDEAIKRVGVSARPSYMVELAGVLAVQEGLKPPSFETVDRRRREILANDPKLIEPLLTEPAIIIDSIILDEPTRIKDEVALPIVTAVLTQPEGWIAAYTVTTTPLGPAEAASLLLPLLDQHAPARKIGFGLSPNRGLRILSDAMMSSGVELIPLPSHPTSGHAFKHIAGESLAGLKINKRKNARKVEVIQTRTSDMEQTILKIQAAIAIHNNARGANGASAECPSIRLSAGSHTTSLAETLRWICAMPEHVNSPVQDSI